jgi:hypothetical protein
MMPKEDYDSLRTRYFYDNIAPKINPSEHEGARQQFMSRTERKPLLNPMEKLGHQVALAGMSMAESMVSPLEITPQTAKVHQFVKGAVQDLERIGKREGMPTAPAEVVGQIVGMGIPLAGATKVAGMITNPIIKTAMGAAKNLELTQRIVRDSLGFAAYNAASEEHGSRWLSGAEGAALGAGAGVIGNLFRRGAKTVESEFKAKLEQGADVEPTKLALQASKEVAESAQATSNSEALTKRPINVVHVEGDSKSYITLQARGKQGAGLSYDLRQATKDVDQRLEDALGWLDSSNTKFEMKLESIRYTSDRAEEATSLLAKLGDDFEVKHSTVVLEHAIGGKRASTAEGFRKAMSAIDKVGTDSKTMGAGAQAFLFDKFDFSRRVQAIWNPLITEQEAATHLKGLQEATKYYGLNPEDVLKMVPKSLQPKFGNMVKGSLENPELKAHFDTLSKIEAENLLLSRVSEPKLNMDLTDALKGVSEDKLANLRSFGYIESLPGGGYILKKTELFAETPEELRRIVAGRPNYDAIERAVNMYGKQVPSAHGAVPTKEFPKELFKEGWKIESLDPDSKKSLTQAINRFWEPEVSEAEKRGIVSVWGKYVKDTGMFPKEYDKWLIAPMKDLELAAKEDAIRKLLLKKGISPADVDLEYLTEIGPVGLEQALSIQKSTKGIPWRSLQRAYAEEVTGTKPGEPVPSKVVSNYIRTPRPKISDIPPHPMLDREAFLAKFERPGAVAPATLTYTAQRLKDVTGYEADELVRLGVFTTRPAMSSSGPLGYPVYEINREFLRGEGIFAKIAEATDKVLRHHSVEGDKFGLEILTPPSERRSIEIGKARERGVISRSVLGPGELGATTERTTTGLVTTAAQAEKAFGIGTKGISDLKPHIIYDIESLDKLHIDHELWHANLRLAGINIVTYLEKLPNQLQRAIVKLADGLAISPSYSISQRESLMEEALVHTAAAIRTGDQAFLEKLAKIDTSVEHLKAIVQGSMRMIALDTAGKATAVDRIINRRANFLHALAAPNIQGELTKWADKLGQMIYWDPIVDQWIAKGVNGVSKTFNSKGALVNHLDKMSKMELMIPDYTHDFNRLVGGKFEDMKFAHLFQDTRDVVDVASRPRRPLPDFVPENIKVGFLAASALWKPAKGWFAMADKKLNDIFLLKNKSVPLLDKFIKADIAVEAKGKWRANSYQDRVNLAKSVVGQRPDDVSRLMAYDERDWPKIAKTMNFSDADLEAVRKVKDWGRYNTADSMIEGTVPQEILDIRAIPANKIKPRGQQVISPPSLTAGVRDKGLTEATMVQRPVKPQFIAPDAGYKPTKESIDFNHYMRTVRPELEKANFDLDNYYGRKYNAKEAGSIERLLRDPYSTFDPKDTNVLNIMQEFVYATAEQKFGKELDDLMSLTKLKTSEGERIIPKLINDQIEKYVDYSKGRPDITAQWLNENVKNIQSTMSETFKNANKYLPKGAQLPTEFSPPKDAINRYMVFSYAAGIGGRMAIAARDSLQPIFTTVPTFVGSGVRGMIHLSRAFGETMTAKTWEWAKKNGYLLDNKNFGELLGDITGELTPGQQGIGKWAEDTANILLSPSRKGHQEGRVWSARAEFNRAMEAIPKLRAGSIQPYDFIKDYTHIWNTDPAMRTELLRMALDPKLNIEAVSHRFARNLVDETCWPYRRSTQPAALRTGLGRVFGQYGLWPLNYLDFLKRTSRNALEFPANGARMAAAWAATSTMAYQGMEAIGADVSKWFFVSPAGFAGSPHLQAVKNLAKFLEETQEGKRSRKELLEYPMQFFPGAVEIQSIFKAMDENTGDLFVPGGSFRVNPGVLRVLGFKPKKEELDKDLAEWTASELGHPYGWKGKP